MPPCLKFHIDVELDQVRQKKNTGKNKGGQIKRDIQPGKPTVASWRPEKT
jgi:hypothetical protein